VVIGDYGYWGFSSLHWRFCWRAVVAGVVAAKKKKSKHPRMLLSPRTL